MPTVTLERQARAPAPIAWAAESADAEAPSGGQATIPRIQRPRYVYKGSGDPHWQGQSCEIDTLAEPDLVSPTVILACGCRASVPWWTLERVPDGDLQRA